MILNEHCKFVRLKKEFGVVILLFFLCQTLGCGSLNEEGKFSFFFSFSSYGFCLFLEKMEEKRCIVNGEVMSLALLRLKEKVVNDPFGALWDWKKEDGEVDHCSGVQCSDDDKVVVLNLRDIHLEGTLAPELGNLAHIKSIFVDNNELLNQPSEATKPTCNQRKLLQKIPVKPPEAPNFSVSPLAHRGRNYPAFKPSPNASAPSNSSPHHQTAILAGAIGGSICLLILIAIAYLFQTSKVSPVKPWKTGLSGQLQKAFVTGVLKLERSELEAACEDFSNVIGSSTTGTVYKGTLSNGVEIAVASFPVKSAKDWSKDLETKFRNKVDTLSKVNHKNFVNLLGYCEETEPFTRMMVFEYAPNGTLFEHLHIQESEHLDWMVRLRIIMGMAYCLEHMHHLNPPIPHKNLSSSAVVLTEDYAAKISDPCFTTLSDTPSTTPESNVYTFGVLLFETVTGRMPYMVDRGSLDDWASHFLRTKQALVEIVDPTLKSFDKKQVECIGEVINACVHPEPGQRPKMKEVSTRLREITSVTPDVATPKLSPLWWAELEIMSAEA